MKITCQVITNQYDDTKPYSKLKIPPGCLIPDGIYARNANMMTETARCVIMNNLVRKSERKRWNYFAVPIGFVVVKIASISIQAFKEGELNVGVPRGRPQPETSRKATGIR